MSVAAIALWAVIAQTTTATVAPADPATIELDVRTSLRTETDEEAWAAPGFRVGLGYSFEHLAGGGDAPGGPLHSALVRVGARLDESWSLMATLRYGVVPGVPPMLRFSGTVEPTFTVGGALSLAVGLGLGGLVHPDTGAPTPEPADPLIASLTLRGTRPLLGACSGTGVIALARVEYLFFAGDLFAAGPSAHADVQWTACVETLTRVDPDSGESIVLRQYWRHLGVGLGWTFWWR